MRTQQSEGATAPLRPDVTDGIPGWFLPGRNGGGGGARCAALSSTQAGAHPVKSRGACGAPRGARPAQSLRWRLGLFSGRLLNF